MRYGCVNHTTFATCAADQSNWCTWHEEARRCGMYYDDADFVHLMLWSGTKVACNSSKVAAIVACSYGSSAKECAGLKGCTWSEGTCYPKFYAPIISKPKTLAAFKRQVHTADPAVWGSCAGTELYRSYSSICNHGPEACKLDRNCHYINEYEIEVANNPLNFTKPCLLSTTRFPIESVFLQVNSNFSAAVFGTQKKCVMATTQANCTERKANISSSALKDSMLYKASETPLKPATGDAAAVPKPDAAAGAGSNTFVVSWAQMEPSALLHLGNAAEHGGSGTNTAAAATNSSSKPTQNSAALKGDGQVEAGLAAESMTSNKVTAPLAVASRKKVVRESAPAPLPIKAPWTSNLPPLFSTLASLALPRTMPTIPMPTASGPLPTPLPAAAMPLLPRLPLLSSNSTGSGCTTIATCRAAFVSLKKLRVIVDVAPAMPDGIQSMNLGQPIVPLV
ncbi:hypothetical protein OEZ85_005834 [Tetradesmus obliquus]|uniref:Uncharacterized protein n=1 Tax=Tetradesmus obliquus TaxID=3088 RepID=A0ABY8UI04_TETOB|nr:hypothetical protein OEZ85_005834 [Tetradesmus obliquus]